MNRPASIVTFERLYLGSFAIWLIGLIVFWRQFQLQIAISAAPYPSKVAGVAHDVATGSVVVVALGTLLLWYLVARRASLVAAWAVIITEAFGALSVLMALVRIVSGHSGLMADGYINLVASIMAIVAAAFLLKPDAKAWLGAKRPTPGVEVL